MVSDVRAPKKISSCLVVETSLITQLYNCTKGTATCQRGPCGATASCQGKLLADLMFLSWASWCSPHRRRSFALLLSEAWTQPGTKELSGSTEVDLNGLGFDLPDLCCFQWLLKLGRCQCFLDSHKKYIIFTCCPVFATDQGIHCYPFLWKKIKLVAENLFNNPVLKPWTFDKNGSQIPPV